ncbi:protein of unknown function [Methylocaldum szegediense]|uniref:Transposase IS4-like domain-containing protein n=1 Tax=Methylocaldum szegediense TaxID=73780 RepID=A0ABM9I7A6_9GAMM|nr:protein of unknown function [Methylocaldum szegediense]
MRGSLNRFEDRRAAQVVSAFAVGERIVLGQVLIEDAGKDHDIQAAQRLIETLGLAGRLYTLDVLHLQKTVEAAIATGSDLLVQLKGNHPKLYAAVQAVCQTQPHAEQTYTVDLGRRNRIEQRTAWVCPLPEGTGPEPWHDHFKAVVEVPHHVAEFTPRHRCFAPRQAPIAYYLVTPTPRRPRWPRLFAVTGKSKTGSTTCWTPHLARMRAASARTPVYSLIFAISR